MNVRIDCIEILSFPGPVPPVDNKLLKRPRVVARDYRNRRNGDFLKELSLTEGRSTGIPKMIRACKRNGSPLPIFETDDDRTYFLTTIPIHPDVIKAKSAKETAAQLVTKGRVEAESGQSQKAESGFSIEERILGMLQHSDLSKLEISHSLGKKQPDGQINSIIRRLLEEGKIERTIPDKPNSRLQKYRLTNSGQRIIKNRL